MSDEQLQQLTTGFRAFNDRAQTLNGDWSAIVPGYDGWNCKDVLAHLSSTAAALSAIAATAGVAPAPDAPPFDPERWNASQIRRRKELSPADMIRELTMGTDRLLEELPGLPLDSAVAVGPYAGIALGDAMGKMLDHQVDHVADLERALAGG